MERFDPVEREKRQWLQNAWREGADSGDAGEIDFSELKQEARRRLGNLNRHPRSIPGWIASSPCQPGNGAQGSTSANPV
jgi:hypothetical protein